MSPKLTTSFALNLVIICILCACTEPPREDPQLQFKFAGKITVDPLKKSYNLGDTIWLKYSNPGKTLTDIPTGKIMNSDSLALQFKVSFNSIYAPAVQAPFCRYIAPGASDQGIISGQSGTGFYGLFGCRPPSESDFTLGVIPEKKGIFGLYLSESLQLVTGCQALSTQFPRSGISYKFDAADGNKDIYLSIPPGTLPEEVPRGALGSWIDEKRVLVIKVE